MAFLDPRMVTARYAGFLQRSVPSFWPTTDRDLVLGALQRLDATAEPVLPVREPRRGRPVPGPGSETVPTGEAAADTVKHVEPVAPVAPVEPVAPVAPVETAHDLFTPPLATGAPVVDATRTGVTRGHPWSADADDELRGGAELGLDIDELADHLGRPEAEIAHRLRSLGLGLGLGQGGAAQDEA